MTAVPWRLIEFGYFNAATNMAIDEAILEAHLLGHVPPTLRFYCFRPSTVSVGYSQKLSPAFIDRVKKHKFDLVRRPTGGRAVLHLNDITYSFVGTVESPGAVTQRSELTYIDEDGGSLSQSVLHAYKQICLGLINAFRIWGIPAEIGQTTCSYRDKQDCFATTTGADLHVEGKKIVGSAQLRRKHALLQHGSIVLKQNQAVMQELLGVNANTDGPARHINLFDIMGKEMTMEALQSTLVQGFALAFNREFEPAPLTKQELTCIDRFSQKYAQLL